MQGGSLLSGRAPVIAPLTGLDIGRPPAAPLETSRLDHSWRPEPGATVPHRVLVPATSSNAANASYQPVEAPMKQEDGAALSTTGTSAERLDPACQTNSPERPPRIAPARFSQTAKPTTATPEATDADGVSVALTSP